MKKLCFVSLILVTLVISCKEKQSAKGAESASLQQSIEDEHKASVLRCIGLASEFEKVCAQIKDAGSFDEHLPELNDVSVKLLDNAIKLRSLSPLSKEESKRLMRELEEAMKGFQNSSKSSQTLVEIESRKDEVAVVLEEFDSAMFANYMSFTMLYMDRDASKYGGELTTPIEAHVDLSDTVLLQFKGDLKKTLFRYLAGNPRWEIREERDKIYAVRLEGVAQYRTTLNGFYSANGKQTRVLLAFDKEYGFGRERGNLTRVKAGAKDVSLTIEAPHSGIPGFSSYTLIGGGEVFLEIYDQDPDQKRTFTQKTFNEVSEELRDVIKYRKAIDDCGVMALRSRYPVRLPTEHFFKVKDAFQPGIFMISASVNTVQSGTCYIKAFNVETGVRLSEKRLTPRSTRHVGWSNDGKNHFAYSSQVTIYEGNWTTEYEARFELWHKIADGTEKKLAETKRMIHGWQR